MKTRLKKLTTTRLLLYSYYDTSQHSRLRKQQHNHTARARISILKLPSPIYIRTRRIARFQLRTKCISTFAAFAYNQNTKVALSRSRIYQATNYTFKYSTGENRALLVRAPMYVRARVNSSEYVKITRAP